MAFLHEQIEEQDILDIVPNAFIDYAMSVIIARALPDVRDGLKPVHRRILYAMNDLGITSDKAFKKSARIVGEVIGKYHPHGDSAVYETMARMAQPWNMRNMLVNGHGNFGSMDGDGAAAMRYTEAKLTKIAEELLNGLKKDAVPFVDNYDGSEQEPAVLPAKYPNLLVNGSEGIAVGMATKIPPHNLVEIINAVIAQIDNEDITIEELMTHVKGPDFPTRAQIMGQEGIKKAYETGKGSFVVRAVTEIKETKGRHTIIVRQIPYQVNKLELVKQIKKLQDDHDVYERERAKNTKTKEQPKEKGFDFAVKDGVKDTSQQRDGNTDVEIQIMLKKGVEPELVLNNLYKHTSLQISYSMNNLSLVPKMEDGKEILEPRVLTLKETLAEYIKHQIEVYKKEIQFDLAKAKKRDHKLAGLLKALERLDETVETIRSATSNQDANEKLMALLQIDKEQAEGILEEKLRRLASFEMDRLKEEQINLAKEIAILEAKLTNEDLLKEDIKEDLRRVSDKYGTDRLTTIAGEVEDFDREDLIEDIEVVITLTNNGFIKRTKESQYRAQRRKGIGVNGMSMYEDDFIRNILIAKNKDTLLYFTNKGRVYAKKAWQITEANANSRGRNLRLFLQLDADEKVQALMCVRDFSEDQYIFFATKKGNVKKTQLSDYANIRRNGIIAINMREDDELVSAALTNGKRNVTLVTKKAMSITFNEEEVRVLSRSAMGVRGIKLNAGDEVVSSAIHEENGELLIVTNEGYGKRTESSEFRPQARGGKGMKCTKTTDKNGEVIGSEIVQEEDIVMLITKNGTLIKLRVRELARYGRVAQGTKVINLREDDTLQGMARLAEGEEDEDLETPETEGTEETEEDTTL